MFPSRYPSVAAAGVMPADTRFLVANDQIERRRASPDGPMVNKTVFPSASATGEEMTAVDPPESLVNSALTAPPEPATAQSPFDVPITIVSFAIHVMPRTVLFTDVPSDTT